LKKERKKKKGEKNEKPNFGVYFVVLLEKMSSLSTEKPPTTLRKRRSDLQNHATSNTSKPLTSSTPSRSSSRNKLVQTGPPQSALYKFLVRVVMGAVMIGAFCLILYGGHMYAWCLVVVLQTLLFRELVNVRYRAAAEKNIPWFRSVQVCFVCVSDFWYMYIVVCLADFICFMNKTVVLVFCGFVVQLR
jgi:hypothetical protein